MILPGIYFKWHIIYLQKQIIGPVQHQDKCLLCLQVSGLEATCLAWGKGKSLNLEEKELDVRCKTELGNPVAVIGATQRIKQFGKIEIGESVTKKKDQQK